MSYKIILAAATWTDVTVALTDQGNNLTILTKLTDARVSVVPIGVTPSGATAGTAVTADSAMQVMVPANSTDAVWMYSVAGGIVLFNGSGTSDIVVGDKDIVLGTTGTGVTAKHFSADGYHFVTQLTVAGIMPAIAGGAALGVGLLAYTFPAGVHSVKSARVKLALQQVDGFVTADTPELSLGSVIVVGAVATMTTATWEDILTAQVMNDCDGTVENKALISATAGHIVNEAAGLKTVYINIADTWAANGDATLGVDGTIWLEWTKLGA